MQKKLHFNKVIDFFDFKKKTRLLYSSFLVLSFFCLSDGFSQTTLINPVNEGGFNLGNTFAENGWTVANEGTGPIKWTVGTAASGTTAIGDTTSGSATVTLSAPNANISVGQIVYGTNIPVNAFVQSIAGTTLTLSQNATASSTGVALGFGRYSGGISISTTQLTTASIAANTYSVTLALANPNISVGMAIAPIPGVIDTNTYVASINGTTLGLSKASMNGSPLAVAQTLAFTATSSSISGNAAYVSNDNGISYSYAGSPANRTIYFYRDINVPSAEKAITLTFDVKSDVASSGAGWQVWVAPISQTVIGTNTQVTTSGTHGVTWPGATLISFNSNPQVATTKTTAFIPKSFAGTPFRLIFVWTNGSSAGVLPPAAIDNISLISRMPEEITCAHSGLWSQPGTWDGGNVPTLADTTVLDNDGEMVVIDSRYSGCEDLILAGTNTLVQFALSSTMDEFTINNDMNLAAGGARFNNHDGTTNSKYLKVGHNIDIGAGARLDSSLGGNTNFQGRLTLNGTLPQTVTVNPAGFVGGSAAGTNAYGNRAGVLNQLEVTNTSSITPNIIWNVDGVRINGGLFLTSGRISIPSGKRIILGNFGQLNGVNCLPGTGFTNGTVSKWINAQNTKNVHPGTEYPGTDNNYKPYWYPFINASGLDRSLYLLPEVMPTTGSEVAVTYTDASTVTSSLSIADGSYTINKRYNGNWTISTPDGNSIPAGSAVIYANAANHRVGVYANGAFEAIDGSARLMNSAAALTGTHQDGTAQPFVFRKNLSLATLTAAPIYVGINDASVLNTSTGIISASSGDWNTPSTWVGSVVPTCNDVVTIANGHNVTVTTTADAAGVVIAKGATLTNNAGATTMTVGCINNNAAFYNYGTHTMTAGNLKVNGFVAHKTGSFFNQTGGDIIIDSNNDGDIATSVAFGGTACKIETANLNLTGGKITIVDPLVNIGTPVSATSIGSYTLNTAGAAGTFTLNGSATGNTVSMASGTYNMFEVGQEVSGNASIPAGTTITAVTVGNTGNPPQVTLTLSASVTAPITAGTPLNFSSMKNGGSTVVLEANASNSNLAIGSAVSGTGIQSGAKITGLNYNGLGTNFLAKVTLSLPVIGLVSSPITSQKTLTFAAVNPGAYATILTAANPNITQGMTVSGSGIKPGTFVANISGVNLTLSEPIQVGAPSPLVMNFQSFNTISSGSFIYASPIHYAAGLNHTLQIGDGVSIQNSTLVSNGFNCQFQALGGLFSLGNLTVDAPNGNERFMNVSSNNINNTYNMNVQNALTVTAGSAFRKTYASGTVYVGGNIVNNGTINFPKASTGLYLGNFINGVAAPTALAQTISGSGIFATNQWSLSSGLDNAAFNSMSVNNTNAAGVTISVPNFRVGGNVTMTNGILHTSSAFPLYVGNPDVMSSTISSGTISGGSATTYIDGPVAHANMASATIGQYKLFPLGKNGKYLPILIASTGGVELMAEAFDTNTGAAGVGTSNLSATRWKVSRVGAAGAFTGYNVRLGSNPNVTASNLIVHATTDQGVYDLVSTPVSDTAFELAYYATSNTPTIYLATPQTGGFLGNFAYAEGPACTGTPNPGATIASTTSVCSGQSVTLSLTTPTTGTGVTYQWQSSINGGSTWTDISGATAATYTATPSMDTSYQCNVTCSAITVPSTPVAVTTVASSATVTGATICTSGTANLTAAGSTILNWYDAPAGGNLVATGTSYSPNVSLTTTYYVSSGSESTGSINSSAYAGTNTSSALFKGIAFDVTNKLRLKTVTVYPKNTASLTPITISLFDATGTIVSGTAPVTFIPTLVTGTVGTVSQVVTLNYDIPVGTGYRLVATNGLVATNNTLGNSTAVITYPTSGPLKLTGNVSALGDAIVATANTTNCFHNLTFDEICESVRVPVTATVVNIPVPTANVTAQPTCSVATGTIEVSDPIGATLEYSIDGATYQTSTTFVDVVSGTYNVTARNTVGECVSSATSVTINVAPTTPTAPIANVTAQPTCSVTTGTIEVSAPTGATLEYSIDGATYQASTTFVDVVSGTYNVTVRNTVGGCISSATSVTINAAPTTPSAPAGSSTQDSCITGTIADFSVTGTGLIWYDAATLGNVIPTSTIAVLNATYYVSQTVNGCEGPRLAILASGPCLGTDSFEIANLKYYPNPVTDQLTITAKDMITRVELYNLLGQQIRVLETNMDTVQLNMSGFTSSTYLVKVYSQDRVQSFKVIKK